MTSAKRKVGDLLEIDVFKDRNNPLLDGLINGELFLELPDDKELLDDLNLSPAFKRLVKKRAEKVYR